MSKRCITYGDFEPGFAEEHTGLFLVGIFTVAGIIGAGVYTAAEQLDNQTIKIPATASDIGKTSFRHGLDGEIFVFNKVNAEDASSVDCDGGERQAKPGPDGSVRIICQLLEDNKIITVSLPESKESK